MPTLINCSSVECPVSCGPNQQGTTVAGNYGNDSQMIAQTGTEGSCCWQASVNYIQANCDMAGGGIYGKAPNVLAEGMTKRVGGVSGTGSRRPSVVRTGQTAKFANQSGSDSSDKILGLTATQLLIAGAVGVGAYLILKKKKK